MHWAAALVKRNIFWPGCSKVPNQVINLLGLEEDWSKGAPETPSPALHCAGNPAGHHFGDQAPPQNVFNSLPLRDLLFRYGGLGAGRVSLGMLSAQQKSWQGLWECLCNEQL